MSSPSNFAFSDSSSLGSKSPFVLVVFKIELLFSPISIVLIFIVIVLSEVSFTILTNVRRIFLQPWMPARPVLCLSQLFLERGDNTAGK